MYPYLAYIIRDIFTISITKVIVERTFNIARDVISN